jgi:hypothetical protein
VRDSPLALVLRRTRVVHSLSLFTFRSFIVMHGPGFLLSLVLASSALAQHIQDVVRKTFDADVQCLTECIVLYVMEPILAFCVPEDTFATGRVRHSRTGGPSEHHDQCTCKSCVWSLRILRSLARKPRKPLVIWGI